MEWRTSISSAGEDAEIRGEKLENVMELPFSDAVFLVLSGRKPSDDESELFSTVLSSCVDHGVGNPSTVSARTVQSGGNKPNTSIAAGIMAMGDSHGGAITPCMKMLRDEEPGAAVESRLESGEKVPGLGHKVYEDGDPRAERILELAGELELSGEYIQRLQEVQKALEDRKVWLPVNVDGAVAAVLLEMGWDPKLGNSVFIVARTPGLAAHVAEEQSREDFRRQDGEYTG